MESEDLIYLREVVAAGSLSAVARRLAIAVSTVARRLDAIEGALKLTLVERGRDGVSPTAHGTRILRLAEPLLAEVDRLSRTADALRLDRTREVVVTATEFVVSDILAPALAKLPPDIRLDLRSQATVVSLAGREADIAVRMSRPEGASLIAKKMRALEIGLFCSREYLADRDPVRLALAEERLLVYDDSYGRLPELGWIDPRMTQAVVARTNSTRGLLKMAQAGAGIAILPVAFAKAAKLIAVCPDVRLPTRTPWIVTHADLRRRPDVRLVHKWIVDAFGAIERVRIE